MENVSPSNCDDYSSKPPAPRPRRPIRNIVISQGNDPHTFTNSERLLTKTNIYHYKYKNRECLNTSKSDDPYTDDDEDDNENSSFSFLNKTSFIQDNQPTDQSLTKHNTRLYIGFGIVFFAVVFSIVVMNNIPKNEDRLPNAKEINLTIIDNIDESIKIIQAKFRNQRANIWNDISTAIYDVALFPTRPSIIILFGDGADTLNCLAQLLGQLSGKILGSNDYLTLTPRDFPNDVGQTIHKLKVPILEKKAVVVKELLNINTKAIKAFHNFCDREMPLVKHSIYIITITVNGYKSSQRELEFISKQIFERLSSYIDEDILYPLITRLTDGAVVSVVPESSTNFNHADCLIN